MSNNYKGRLVEFPMFEMGSYPSIKISDIKSRIFSIMDRHEKEYRIYF